MNPPEKPGDTSTPPDPVELAAGLSLRAPEPVRKITGLSFGHAEFTRPVSFGPRYLNLRLHLTPKAAEACGAAGASTHTTVDATFLASPHDILGGADLADKSGGLRALVAERHLLSHPSLLRRNVIPQDYGAAERAALAALQRRYTSVTSADGVFGYTKQCVPCATLWREREQKRVIESVTQRRTELTTQLARASDRYEVARLRSELANLNWSFNTQMLARSPDPCPHVAMAREAFAKLCDEHPEVAFELVGLIVPEAGERPGRYVLNPAVFLQMAGEWLVGRTRDAYGYAMPQSRWLDPRWGRWRPSRGKSRSFSAKGIALTSEIPESDQVAVRFAATAWHTSEPVERLWRAADAPSPEAPPAFSPEAQADERLEVPKLIPALSAPSSKAPPPAKKPAMTRKKK